MKNLIILFLCCITFTTARAQAGSLNVVNNTACTVYYIVKGNPFGSCSTGISSVFIALMPFGSVSYPNASALPGGTFPPGANINGAALYPGTSSCGAAISAVVGEPCSGYPLTGSYMGLNTICSFCRATNINAVWTPAISSGGTATLTFN